MIKKIGNISITVNLQHNKNIYSNRWIAKYMYLVRLQKNVFIRIRYTCVAVFFFNISFFKLKEILDFLTLIIFIARIVQTLPRAPVSKKYI